MILEWKRYPFTNTGKANYELLADGEYVGVLRWCGHPTATYPYFTHDSGELRTFRTVKEGKAFVEECFAQAREAARKVRELR